MILLDADLSTPARSDAAESRGVFGGEPPVAMGEEIAIPKSSVTIHSS